MLVHKKTESRCGVNYNTPFLEYFGLLILAGLKGKHNISHQLQFLLDRVSIFLAVGWLVEEEKKKRALGLFWVKKDLTLKKCIIYILVLVFGAKIVPNVEWHGIFFCLSIVCGWTLLIKTHCGREQYEYVCVAGGSVLFFNGLSDRLDGVCWVVSPLFPVFFLHSKTGRTTHLYTDVQEFLWRGRSMSTNLPVPTLQPLQLVLNPILLNFQAESDNLEKCQNPQ